MNRYRRFTDTERSDIYALLDKGVPQTAIAERYGRTQQAISYLKVRVRNGSYTIRHRL